MVGRIVLLLALLLLPTASPAAAGGATMPWRKAGLTKREAAAHLVSRFTFGASPRLIDHVVDTGLEKWFAGQIAGSAREPELDRRLVSLTALDLPLAVHLERFPTMLTVLREAMDAGVIPQETTLQTFPMGPKREELRRELISFAAERGYRSQRNLIDTLLTQKVVRAIYAQNQVHEVLTDFWFNHFNVALSDSVARPYVLAYERDAIRPHVTGNFRELLGATARHPAMLFYLDNTRSTADAGKPTTLEKRIAQRSSARGEPRRGSGEELESSMTDFRQGRQGLNENYARELLELHTLGVDGGYTQKDVVAVARAFTGWAAVPRGSDRSEIEERMARAERADVGFVFGDGFMFRADAHDAGGKTVLGRRLPPGRGIEDGEEVLDLVALHPSTARHLAHKLAVRFIADEPPSTAVDRLAAAFLETDGDLAAVLRELVALPEFWDAAYRGAKIKSPFELAVSALRGLDADVRRTPDLVEWIGRMGQPLYDYQAPTGFPDRADHWVNAGALLNRMSFGLALATGSMNGVFFDFGSLLGNSEPESRAAALDAYLALLLPERDVSATAKLLRPMIEAPDLASRVDRAAPRGARHPAGDRMDDELEDEIRRLFDPDDGESRRGPSDADRTAAAPIPSALAQVVGVILGSPEFQRR